MSDAISSFIVDRVTNIFSYPDSWINPILSGNKFQLYFLFWILSWKLYDLIGNVLFCNIILVNRIIKGIQVNYLFYDRLTIIFL